MIQLYLKMSIVLIVVNIIGDYIPNPIVYQGIHKTKPFGYPGRFGLGQAPITLFPLLLIFIYQLSIGLKMNKAYLLTFICALCLLAGIATTAIVSLAVTFLIFALISFWGKREFSRGRRFVLMSIIVLPISILFILHYAESFDIDLLLFATKIGSVISGDLDSDPSMALRLNATQAIGAAQLPLFQTLFGRTYHYWHIIGGFGPVENTYYDLYGASGIIGISCFIVFLLHHFLRNTASILRKGVKSFACLTLLLFVVMSLYA
jgi:uncharacterized membrane protein YphA (DoxX/SURF4 family)